MELQMTDSYSRAYVEILEIINYMGEEYRRKIPIKLLNFFEENKDIDYIYQSTQKTSNGFFLEETIALLSVLESKYWANSQEKVLLKKALKDNEVKYQKQLKEKYNPDNLFQKTIQVKEIDEVITDAFIIDDVAMVEYKESIFKKFINKIKSIFKIK